ncbi:P-loop containing nucleoside triphosphate hydrolase protein [Chaetomium sp. MPI-CAGE-AT-0009]|nr:P-loop containing nucleoside triphosphate hydrolase protein [Chaetomium sp. MPI-CAGE-AT-0009]
MASRSLRYHTIPYPQNPGFYGRDDILKDIAAAFEEQVTGIASVAIWGTAGIGKTQIALELAHRHWLDGEGAILWIASETPAEVAKSFNNAALQLQFEDYSESNDPDKNRHLVLQWLQNTDVPWLLVFDDVSSHKELVQNWPTVGRGKILVTCRSGLLAESGPVATSIEVPIFTVAQSTELILQILNNKSAATYEVAATNRLSAKLGGLALAVDIIAKQIKFSRHFTSVSDYYPEYLGPNQSSLLKRLRHQNGDLWYSKTFNKLWQTAFDNLTKDASEMLGILCFMSREDIPKDLFYPTNLSINRFKELADSLLDSSLVRIDAAMGSISVHPLIQESYFSQMTTESRGKAFDRALSLLRAHFPRQQRDDTMYWSIRRDQCGTLHQHIKAFNERYRSMKARNRFSTENLQYIKLIRDHAWYLVEIQHFAEAEASFVSLLADSEKDSLLAARIYRGLMGLYERTGRSKKACAAANKEFDILRKHVPGREEWEAIMANAHGKMGYSLVSAYKVAEAILHLNRAVDVAKAHPEPKCYQDFRIDRFLRNRGRCREQLGQLDGALRDFLEAEDFQDKIYGPDSYYDGETKYERAKLAVRRGDLEEAAELSREAYTLLSPDRETDPSVAAALYQRGRIAMLQGGDDTALPLLKQALAICQGHESRGGNPGEAARIRWRMAQVYERMGNAEEAGRLRAEAERVRRKLLATGDCAVVEVEGNEEAGWDALVGLFYR